MACFPVDGFPPREMPASWVVGLIVPMVRCAVKGLYSGRRGPLVMRISEMNWMQVRDQRGQGRSRGAAGRLDRAACAPEPVGRQHPVGARRRRSGRAAANSGVSGDPLRPHAELRRISRHGHAAHEHDVRARDRRARRHRQIRLPPHPDRERARRKYPGPRRRARMARAQSRLPGAMAQLVECAEDLGQGDGDRSGRLACVVAGEFSRGRGSPVSRNPRRRSP